MAMSVNLPMFGVFDVLYGFAAPYACVQRQLDLQPILS